MSTLSKAEAKTEAKAEAAALEEALEATVALQPTASQTLRQRATVKATAKAQSSLPIPPEPVIGTGDLGRKVLNAQPTAPNTTHSSRLKSRETGKGADVSERGDPLLLNNIV